MFQRPIPASALAPGFQGREQRLHCKEVFLKIRAEIQPGALPRPSGGRLKKIRQQQAVLVVAFLGPRVRKKYPDFFEGYPGWQGEQKFPGFGEKKVTVGKPGALRFAPAPVNAHPSQIHAHADFLRKFRCIADQEMPVTAADFPDNCARFREKGGQLGPQRDTPPGD